MVVKWEAWGHLLGGLPARLTVHWSPVVTVTYDHGGSRQSRVVILQCQSSGVPVGLGLASGTAPPEGSRETCLPCPSLLVVSLQPLSPLSHPL